MEIPSSLALFLPSADALLPLFGEDPLVRALQIGLGIAASLLVFLLFYTTRDILARTHSILAQLSAILLVALLPVAGFLLYLLLRPARTLRERELADAVTELLRHARAPDAASSSPTLEFTARAIAGAAEEVCPVAEEPLVLASH